MPDAPPSTPASTEATPTQQPTTPAQATAPKVDAQGLQRAIQARQKERELSARADSLKPFQEAQALAKQGKWADAVKTMAAGADINEVYQHLTEAVLGNKDEETKLAALPRSVREQLEEARRFREEASGKLSAVEKLEAELKELRGQRDAAVKSFEAREQETRATQTFASGYQSVAQAEGLDLLRAHPQGQGLVQQAWVALLNEKKAELGGLKPQERWELAQKLVAEAAKSVNTKLETEAGWLLQSDWAKGKLLGEVKPAVRGRAPVKPEASTQASPKTPPRTVPPGDTGEPSGIDWNSLSPRERVRKLNAMERAGTLTSG